MAEKTSDVSTDSDLNRVKLKRRKHARKVPSDDEEESNKNNDKMNWNVFTSSQDTSNTW